MKAENKKLRHEKMNKAIKSMKKRRTDLDARLSDAFILWRRATIE